MWALVEPLDVWLFRSEYRDIALLGKLVTPGRGWKAAGYALHAANGAVFGLAFDVVLRRSGLGPRRLAVGLALAENLALYPLAVVVDRNHPRRGERDVGPLWSRRGPSPLRRCTTSNASPKTAPFAAWSVYPAAFQPWPGVTSLPSSAMSR